MQWDNRARVILGLIPHLPSQEFASHLHGFIRERGRETAILAAQILTAGLRREGRQFLVSSKDVTSVFASTDHRTLSRHLTLKLSKVGLAVVTLNFKHLFSQKYWARTMYARNRASDGSLTLWIGSGDTTGDSSAPEIFQGVFPPGTAHPGT